MATRLRVERGGPREDRERGLHDGGEPAPRAWQPVEDPGEACFAHEHGHLLTDPEHVILLDQVRVERGAPRVDSVLVLEAPPRVPLPRRAGRGHVLARAARKQVHEVVDIVGDAGTRRRFAQAARRGGMSRRQKRTLLFLALLSAVWLWAVGSALLLAAGSPRLGGWSVAWTLFFASLATNLFVPVPIEALAVTASLGVGALTAAIACGAGKAAGAWIVYALGPALRRGVARLEARSRLMRRVLVGAHAFAVRFGYAALALMVAVPFSPFDIVPVYLFSTLGLRLKPFLAAVFLGFAARVYVVAVFGGALLRALGLS